jgi:hypothetical protein
MGLPDRSLSSKETVLLTPFGEACSRRDLTAIHEILEKVGYKDDEHVANEVIHCLYIFLNNYTFLSAHASLKSA